VSKDAKNAFTDLYHSDGFQAADCFRQQLFVVVDYVRSGVLMIPFTEISTISDMSKAMIVKYS
jgi:hypothetical protein